jgi:hypothetical protein
MQDMEDKEDRGSKDSRDSKGSKGSKDSKGDADVTRDHGVGGNAGNRLIAAHLAHLSSSLKPASLRRSSTSPDEIPFCLSVSSHSGGICDTTNQLSSDRLPVSPRPTLRLPESTLTFFHGMYHFLVYFASLSSSSSSPPPLFLSFSFCSLTYRRSTSYSSPSYSDTHPDQHYNRQERGCEDGYGMGLDMDMDMDMKVDVDMEEQEV